MKISKNSLGLGIDAGGTFTDCAIVDLSEKSVLAKSKTPTMKNDLLSGISSSLNSLNSSLLSQCNVVSLSTTFATNAIIENRGAKAGLILLGYDDYDMAKIKVDPKIAIPGRHDINGYELEPLDKSALRDAIRQLVEADHVEAIAISGMGSVLNPAHEIEAREIVASESGLPVVCGHDLSMELGAILRAMTAYLNARLLPVVIDLVRSVESQLRNKGIKAPLMIVKSDGSLMSASEALSKPVHTILSGPAASAVGAIFLSGEDDAVVVDIGGTTTDILFAENRSVHMSRSGSVVGGFAVCISSVAGYTVGIGGDSHIRRDRLKNLTAGPERVIPVCVLADNHPDILPEIEKLSSELTSILCQPISFIVKGCTAQKTDYSPREKRILSALQNGPKSLIKLALICQCQHPSLLDIDRLEYSGAIVRAGLTPTDILHAAGNFVRWNVKAAEFAVSAYARDLGITSDELISQAKRLISDKLAREILSGTLNLDITGINKKFPELLMNNNSGYLNLHTEFLKPIIGIGAPASSYLPAVCSKFGAIPVIPVHSEVAGAVGAVVGRIVLASMAVISPVGDGLFVLHDSAEFLTFTDIGEAENYAVKRVREELDNGIRKNYHGFHFEIKVNTNRRMARNSEGEMLIESIVSGNALCISTPLGEPQ